MFNDHLTSLEWVGLPDARLEFHLFIYFVISKYKFVAQTHNLHNEGETIQMSCNSLLLNAQVSDACACV